MGGEMEGAGDRATSGDSWDCSGERRGSSGTVKLAKREWKCAGEVAYSGAPKREGRECPSGGRYCAPNSGELAYLLK